MAKAGSIRLDKWLWYARFFKTRSLASKLCQAGRVKVNTVTITKANTLVKPDDVLTFEQSKFIRVIKIVELGTRRGPAPEAQGLYEDLAPPDYGKPDKNDPANLLVAQREAGAGRPTKRERRDMERLRTDRF